MAEEILPIQKRQYNTIIITGIALAILLPYILASLLVTKSMPPVFRVTFVEIIRWATLPAVYFYAIKVEDRDFLLWPEKTRKIWFYVVAITVLFFLTFCDHQISIIPWRLGYHDDYTLMKYYSILFKSNRVLLVLACLTAGFTEELLMRGYMLPRLYMLFKTEYMPIVVSALIFSLLHLGYRNLSEIIFTFIFGLFCAVFYRKYQNIQVLIIFHFLYDYWAYVNS